MWKVQENFKTAHYEAIHMVLFIVTTKTKVCFVCFDSFVIVLLMGNTYDIHIRDFHDTHLNNIWLFQNVWILVSFDLNSVLSRQFSEKVAYKPGLDQLRMFSPEYFCLNHQCFVPKYFKDFGDWGGGRLQPHSPLLNACASLLQVWGTRLQVTQNFMTALCLVFSWWKQ